MLVNCWLTGMALRRAHSTFLGPRSAQSTFCSWQLSNAPAKSISLGLDRSDLDMVRFADEKGLLYIAYGTKNCNTITITSFSCLSHASSFLLWSSVTVHGSTDLTLPSVVSGNGSLSLPPALIVWLHGAARNIIQLSFATRRVNWPCCRDLMKFRSVPLNDLPMASNDDFSIPQSRLVSTQRNLDPTVRIRGDLLLSSHVST